MAALNCAFFKLSRRRTLQAILFVRAPSHPFKLANNRAFIYNRYRIYSNYRRTIDEHMLVPCHVDTVCLVCMRSNIGYIFAFWLFTVYSIARTKTKQITLWWKFTQFVDDVNKNRKNCCFFCRRRGNLTASNATTNIWTNLNYWKIEYHRYY